MSKRQPADYIEGYDPTEIDLEEDYAKWILEQERKRRKEDVILTAALIAIIALLGFIAWVLL